MSQLRLTRKQILAFRRRVGELEERLPLGDRALRRIAWAGLQDSMPRAALLSINARVRGATGRVLDDPSLVQVWGPRFSLFVVPACDRGVFTLGRMPESGARLDLGNELADRIAGYLGDRQLPFGEVAKAIGEPHNRLRYAAPTGRVLLRWDGAHQPLIRAVAAPDMDPISARLELVRRYLHIYGPATSQTFAQWAGVKPQTAEATFASLGKELTEVRTPLGVRLILADDVPAFAADPVAFPSTRLLPSGDAYYLLHGEDRDLLVPQVDRRDQLWTSRVWPGAVLSRGEIIGTWRRSQHKVDIDLWKRISRMVHDAIEEEARAMPLPGIDRDIVVGFRS